MNAKDLAPQSTNSETSTTATTTAAGTAATNVYDDDDDANWEEVCTLQCVLRLFIII